MPTATIGDNFGRLFKSSALIGPSGSSPTPDVVIAGPTTFVPGNSTNRFAIGGGFTLPNMARVAGGSGRIISLTFDNYIDPALGKIDAAVGLTNATAAMTLTNHGFVVGQRVSFVNYTGAANYPTGLSLGTNYFVLTTADANTFTVSTSYGGTTLTVTTAGSGTLVTEVPIGATYSPVVLLSDTAISSTHGSALSLSAATQDGIVIASGLSTNSILPSVFLAAYTSDIRGFTCAAGTTSLFGQLFSNSSSSVVMGVREKMRITATVERN